MFHSQEDSYIILLKKSNSTGKKKELCSFTGSVQLMAIYFLLSFLMKLQLLPRKEDDKSSYTRLLTVLTIIPHRIKEWPGLKVTSKIIEFQPPCYVPGHQPADQAAQSHIQPGLECLQGWDIHNLNSYS